MLSFSKVVFHLYAFIMCYKYAFFLLKSRICMVLPKMNIKQHFCVLEGHCGKGTFLEGLLQTKVSNQIPKPLGNSTCDGGSHFTIYDHVIMSDVSSWFIFNTEVIYYLNWPVIWTNSVHICTFYVCLYQMEIVQLKVHKIYIWQKTFVFYNSLNSKTVWILLLYWR